MFYCRLYGCCVLFFFMLLLLLPTNYKFINCNASTHYSYGTKSTQPTYNLLQFESRYICGIGADKRGRINIKIIMLHLWQIKKKPQHKVHRFCIVLQTQDSSCSLKTHMRFNWQPIWSFLIDAVCLSAG